MTNGKEGYGLLEGDIHGYKVLSRRSVKTSIVSLCRGYPSNTHGWARGANLVWLDCGQSNASKYRKRISGMSQVLGWNSLRHSRGVWRWRTRDDIRLIRWATVRIAWPHKYNGGEVDKIRYQATSRRWWFLSSSYLVLLRDINAGTLVDNSFRGWKLKKGMI